MALSSDVASVLVGLGCEGVVTAVSVLSSSVVALDEPVADVPMGETVAGPPGPVAVLEVPVFEVAVIEVAVLEVVTAEFGLGSALLGAELTSAPDLPSSLHADTTAPADTTATKTIVFQRLIGLPFLSPQAAQVKDARAEVRL